MVSREELVAALRASLACIERQREIADIVAIGDFSTDDTDRQRHELEMMTDVFESELRELLTRVDAEAAS